MKQGLFNLKHVTSPWSGKWEVARATRFLPQGSALEERHLVLLLSFCFPTCNPRSSSISLWQEFSALGRQVMVYQKQLDWARFACDPRRQLCLAVPQLRWLLLVLTGSSGRAWLERTSVRSSCQTGFLREGLWGAIGFRRCEMRTLLVWVGFPSAAVTARQASRALVWQALKNVFSASSSYLELKEFSR